MPENKVRYGLKNVHYAPILIDSPSGLVFGAIKKWPGAVSLSLEAQGDPVEFYADDGVFYGYPVNNGYDGEMEMAEIPDDFRQDCLGEKMIDGVSYEDAETKDVKKFAIMFEFDGDVRATRHVNYYCLASRPTEESGTTTDSIEPQTSTLNFSSRKRPDNGLVKARCTTAASSEIYDNWYTSVHEKPADVSATGITVAPSSANLGIGDTLQLSATVQPANVSIKTVTYSSSDEAIATVDVSGKVTAVASGSATITATSVDGSFTDTCTLTVA